MSLLDYRADGAGPRLYEFRFSRFMPYHDGEPWFQPLPDDYDSFDPPDPPPFLLNDGLPADVRDRVLAEGYHGETIKNLVESGVERIEWRQPNLHLEPWFISDDVFQALNEIAPGSFESVVSISVFFYNTRLYHKFEPVLPARMRDADGRRSDPNTIDGRPLVLTDQCEPPIEPGQRIRDAVWENENMVLAYPSWMARDDMLLAPLGSRVVTEGFVEAWRSTEISRHLRESHWEHDIEFIPSNGTTSNKTAKYRWVDVP